MVMENTISSLTLVFMFFHIDFRISFLLSILANCVHGEICTGILAAISPKSLKFVVQTDFCVHRFRICDKRNSAKTSKSKFRLGLTERVRLKRIFTRGEYTVIQRLCIA